MAVDQNRGKTNEEPVEDGLSALKRLAALDKAGAGASSQGKSSQEAGVVEAIPDWLELLLAKYGEQASMLVGIESHLLGSLQPEGLVDSQPTSEESSKVATLLEQMAAEAEQKPPAERSATSVDWGEPVRDEDEVMEDQATDWLDRTAKPSPPPPVPPVEEEAPDWLSEITESRPEAETPTEPPETAEYSAEEEDVLDWLQELPPPQPSVTPQPVEPSPPEWATSEGEVPDWLRDLDVEASQPEGAPSAPEGEVPDWLKDLGVITSGEEPSEAEETPSTLEGEVPDWLQDLDVEAPPAEETPLPPPHVAESPPDISGMEDVESEVPDWLANLADMSAQEGERQTAPYPEKPPSAEEEELSEEVADRLHALQPDDAVSEPPPSEPPAKAPVEPEAEIPDWLADLRDEERPPLQMEAEEAPSVEYLPGEVAEEPDWLAALRTSGKPDVLEMDEEVVEAEEEALPDWLAELRTSPATDEMPPGDLEVLEETPAGPEAEEEGVLLEPLTEAETEVPDWLAELPVAEHPEPEEAKPPSGDVEYPVDEEEGALDWLAEIEAAAAAAESAEGEVPPAGAEAPPSAGEEAIPDWLRHMPPADLPVDTDIPETEKDSVESAPPSQWLVSETPPGPYEESEVSPVTEEAPAEIPDWLARFEPEEEERAEFPEGEPVEAEDVLAGIPGLLPVAEEETEGEEEPVAALRSRLGVPEVPDVEGARLFKEITTEHLRGSLQELEEKGEVETRPEPRRGRIVETLAWALIFITLIALIALALLAVLDRVGDLLGGPAFREFFGSPLVIDPAPVNTFRAQVTRLPSDAVVVVSFDYSPATEAEMGPLAEIILRDLLESQVRVVTVSLRPEGAAMAQRLLDRFESEYPYGQRTLNLGYLPGQTVGVRSLAFLPSAPLFQNWARTMGDYPAWRDVDGLGDVALIVDVADTPLAVRWWVEQVGPGTLANRPMMAAVSTAADPTVRPYYNQIDPKSGQLLGLISGIAGAAAYENRLRQPGRAVEGLAAQSVAHLSLVVLSLGGTIMGFRSQVIRESRHQGIRDYELDT